MVIGKTQFNVEAVKQMTLKEFVDGHKAFLREIDAVSAYYRITGFNRPMPKKKKKESEDVPSTEE